MSINIKFIAKKAGVSIATVSRVMNGNMKVDGVLRERVLEVAQKYRYEPNAIARSLVFNRTNLLGVVVPNVSDEFHARMLSGIEGLASEKGFDVLVTNMYGNFEREKRSIDTLLSRRVDGILMLHENSETEWQELHGHIGGLPVVLAGVVSGTLPCAGIDNTQAAFDAVEYLLKKGHRRIGCIGGRGETSGRRRLEGYRQALAAYGVTAEARSIVTGDYTYQSGYAGMEALCRSNAGLTAVFAANDEMAVGAMNFLFDSGKRVPDDVSVVGFDDICWASYVRPKLTAIRQPAGEIGAAAAELLIARIGGSPRASHVQLPYKLIERESTQKV